MSHKPAGQICNCGARGWMPGIEHVPIRWQRPAHIRRDDGKMQPYVVVDHIMQGWLNTLVRWAQAAVPTEPGSAIIVHFGIGQAGRTVQFESIYTEGVHVSSVNQPVSSIVKQLGSVAGRGANPYSVAIEHEGFSIDPKLPDANGNIRRATWSRSNPWPAAMVQSSIRVKRWIFAQGGTNLGAPSRSSVIGHYEADARNRPNDPATAAARDVWPVAFMLSELGAGAGTGTPATHTVAAGEALSIIAARYGLTTAQLAQWNGITNPDRISVGQVLRLTAPAGSAPQPQPEPEKPPQLEAGEFAEAWSDFLRAGATPHDYVTVGGQRRARYLVSRAA